MRAQPMPAARLAHNLPNGADGLFAVAPMMDYTNRFLRFLLRRLLLLLPSDLLGSLGRLLCLNSCLQLFHALLLESNRASSRWRPASA